MANNGRDRSTMWLILVALFCILFLGVCVSLCAVEADAAEPVTVVIRDFGKGMTPGLPPYRNAPEDIVLSQNFMSTSPGGRQLRFGYARLDTADVSSDAVRSLALFRPTGDSSHVVYTTGGSWWTTVTGVRRRSYTTIGGDWKDTLAMAFAIRPHNQCDSVIVAGDSVVGFGTRFIRDLQVGDIYNGNDTVKYIVSDTKLKLNSAGGSPGTETSFNPSRSFPDSGSTPYMLQSDDLLYTGALDSPPQIIYAKDDTLRIRQMGMVDSFFIDTIIMKYPPAASGWDSTDLYGHRSWDTLAGAPGREYFTEFQLVSRRKPGQWQGDQWDEDITENPAAYYVRLGYENKTPFYVITGNTDSSIYLASWYVDTLPIDTSGDQWNDSIFFGKGQDTSDFPSPAAVDGTWGYIYSAAGFYRTVVPDEQTDTVKIRGRGALFWAVTGSTLVVDTAKRAGATFIISPKLSDREYYRFARYPDGYWVGAICSLYTGAAAGSTVTVTGWYSGDWWRPDGDSLSFADCGETPAAGDSFHVVHAGPGAFPIDSTDIYEAMHFIRLTGDDVAFPAYDEPSRIYHEWRYRLWSTPPITQAGLPAGDSLLYFENAWYCDETNSWFHVLYDALQCTGKPGNGSAYRIRVTSSGLSKSARAIGGSMFPIRYMSQNDDTVFFITSIATDLTDKSDVSTVNWEIVSVGMPQFTGMTEWNTPPQLVGWGDPESVGLLSFSGVNDPWNWSVSSDVLVGNNPASPIVSVVGYDDQLVIFKPSSMLSFDGRSFRELSQTDGLVGPRAVVGLTKELYWRDVDGIKKMQRRDFSGYSIQKISQALDPVFNSWSATQFGSDMVPVSLGATTRDLTVMTFNQRDRHLYVFTDQVGCFTYDIERGIWDGYHTLAATDAIWTTIRDTSRIIFGGPNGSQVYAMDYSWRDDDTSITGLLRSAKFFITDDKGFPVQSKFLQGWLLARSASGMFDSARVALYGENATDVLAVDFSGEATVTTKQQNFYSSVDNRSTFWYWELKVAGDSAISMFQPQELVLQFLPVTKDDE